MTFRRAFFAASSTAILLGLAWGCAAADNSGEPSSAGGGSNGDVDAGNEASVIMPGSGDQDAGQLGLNPLCGIKHSCVPDSTISCRSFTPPSEEAGAGSDAAVSGQAGANGEGGSGGDSAGPLERSGAGEGGASGAAGASGASGAAGDAGSAGAAGSVAVTSPQYACQVQRTPGEPDVPFSSCVLAGLGGEDAPCLTSDDCQASLGCVGDQSAGKCQRYCCQDADDCEAGTYCAERPLRDATINRASGSSTKPLLVPVCVHAENCDLSAPYPCPKGGDCGCPTGKACLVVRSDGTTTCAVPGTGKLGDSCPCAWGYVCSAASNECLELCYTRGSGTCGEGRCQSASQLPDGWGVCVGVAPNGG